MPVWITTFLFSSNSALVLLWETISLWLWVHVDKANPWFILELVMWHRPNQSKHSTSLAKIIYWTNWQKILLRRISKFLLKGINLVIGVPWSRWGQFSKLLLNNLSSLCNVCPSLYYSFGALKSIISPKNKFPIFCRSWDNNAWLHVLERESGGGGGGSHTFISFSQCLGLQPCLSPLHPTLKFICLGTVEKQRLGRPMTFKIVV